MKRDVILVHDVYSFATSTNTMLFKRVGPDKQMQLNEYTELLMPMSVTKM